MNDSGFSIRTWQDDYYDGYVNFDCTPDENEIEMEAASYREFILDTSDDHILNLKWNAQKLYYRQPFDPLKNSIVHINADGTVIIEMRQKC